VGTLNWMIDVLEHAGVPVVEYPNWRNRAASGSFTPRAVIWHHDASAAGPSPNMDDLIAVQGNSTTPPPLSQVWVDTFGRWHLIAAGRANHAGTGDGWGVIPANAGNQYAIGIETDHTTGEVWQGPLLASLRRGTKALLQHMGASPSNALAAHKEYAAGRKIDPAGLTMATERIAVAQLNLEDDLESDERLWLYRLYLALITGQYDETYGTFPQINKDLGTVRADVGEVKTLVAAVQGTLTTNQLAILAAIQADDDGQVVVDVPALAAALRENLSDEIASELAERLAG
jgi:hypothetical protein